MSSKSTRWPTALVAVAKQPAGDAPPAGTGKVDTIA